MRELLCLAMVVVVAAATTDGLAQSIGQMEREIISLVDDVSESIVSVAAVSGHVPTSSGRTFIPGPASKSVGCGVIFEKGGLILTTTSVVGYARQVEIGTKDGSKYRGVVVGTDAASDLAIVRVDGVDLKPARFGGDTSVRTGSVIFVVGNAFGALPSVSMGVINSVAEVAKDRGGSGMLRMSVPINPGDIGGPVLNATGDIIGIVIGRLTFQSRFSSVWVGEGQRLGVTGPRQLSNLSVAMPSGQALDIAREILETGGSRQRGFLGVHVLDLSEELRLGFGDPDLDGVYVTSVVEGSPAESIGIRRGDVITVIGANPIESVMRLSEVISGTQPGQVINVTYRRGSRSHSEGIRVSRVIPAYVREATFGEDMVKPEEVRARIKDLKTEIDHLKDQLQDLEDDR
jgi:S1-C subfamily serine protease